MGREVNWSLLSRIPTKEPPPGRFHFRPDMPDENNAFRVGLVIALPIAEAFLVFTLIASITTTSPSGFEKLLGFLYAVYGICCVPLYVSHTLITLSDIMLEDTGIRLRIVGPWSVLVPWQALGEMTIKEVRCIPPYEPRRRGLLRRSEKRTLYAVHVPGLTIWHTLTGLCYGLGFCPVFIITPAHERYEALLERLKQAAIEQGADPERLS